MEAIHPLFITRFGFCTALSCSAAISSGSEPCTADVQKRVNVDLEPATMHTVSSRYVSILST